MVSILVKTLKSKMSMRLKKIGDWIQYRTSAGRTFYYNQTSGDFRWDNPNPGHSQPVPITSDWKPYMDSASGSVFWYNHVTQVSQWECPADAQQDMSSVDEIYHDIVEIQNENELGI